MKIQEGTHGPPPLPADAHFEHNTTFKALKNGYVFYYVICAIVMRLTSKVWVV